jgi:basic membrane protein A and related proteins
MTKNLARAAVRCASAASLALATLTYATTAHAQAKEPLKIGFVYVTPIGEAGWTTQHNLGRLELEKVLAGKVKATVVENVPEGADAERVIRDLAAQGHKLIFTTSFGYMEPTLKVAKEFPGVAFEHATGFKSGPNVGNYNARFYEGRYLAGMVAGKMTKSNVAGYVAAFPIPEVLQGINAFTLGMRAVNPKAEVKVVWTSSWYDPPKERDAAVALMNQSADVLTHHTDSTAVVQAAEEKGKMSVGYHSNMAKFGPKGQLTAVTHHWGAYYTRTAQAMLEGKWKPQAGLWGGIKDGFIKLGPIHASVPKDVAALVLAKEADIAAGKFHPFGGAITDNTGKVHQASGQMDDKALGNMDYYVMGVQGKLPQK